jgi:hypothetical protein
MAMAQWLDKSMRFVLAQRMRRIRYFSLHPHQVQEGLRRQLVDINRHTQWGREHHFSSIRTAAHFSAQIPVQDYENLKPYIQRMMMGERDVLWSGSVRWFAKSSGTTNDKSKFIPVTNQNLKTCLIKGTWDSTAMMYDSCPEANFFAGKMLVMGGSYQDYEPYPRTKFGDVSAIMLHSMPAVAKHIYRPSLDIGMMANTEDKLELMARKLIHEDMRLLAGVPTWTVVLLRRVLEMTGKDNILEVWPNLQAYVHGGVSFQPYREQFKQLIPKDDFIYWQIYNASEGFFGAQSESGVDDMLLLLDNGVYYEFLPESEWHKEHGIAIPLEAVEVGKHYAPVITTNSGLWRYVPGDTVVFTSLKPYRIRVSGRTNQFVNAFGEEVMVANTDKALAEACAYFDCSVSDYTVAPIYFRGSNSKGGHEWVIEFEKLPEDLEAFSVYLDNSLQHINSDYEAKRYKSIAMTRLRINAVSKGTFNEWLKSKGKFGGQSKIPRLSNHRRYLEEVMKGVKG